MLDNILIYVLFLIGFYFLIKGSDLLIDGATSLAKRLKISDLVVGLTIVSIGTSTPELFVNVISSLMGAPGIAIGNIFGSNIANILLILGVSAIIYPLPVQQNTVFIEIPFSLTATLLVGFLANATLFQHVELSTLTSMNFLYISRWDGLILIIFFLLFMGYIVKIANEQAYKEKINQIMGLQNTDHNEYKILSLKKTILYIIMGVIALTIGANWVVDGAVKIAKDIGFSDTFVGLTIIAVGTSLPELFTSTVAAYKKQADIAIGNIIGSNIFNMLWILGVSAIINPLPFELISNIDLFIIIIVSSLLIFVLSLGQKYVIERWNGILFLILYITYIIFLVQRG